MRAFDHDCAANPPNADERRLALAVVDGADHGLEFVDVGEEAARARSRDAHDRRRAADAAHARQRDDLHLGERVQMAVEVAVGQTRSARQVR